MTLRLAVCGVLGLAAGAAAWGQGTVTDQAVSLTYKPSHWSERPLSALVGTEPQTPVTPRLVYEFGWWYRFAGDTREHPFPPPDVQTYANGGIKAVWYNLDGHALTFTEYTDVLDNEGPSGLVYSRVVVQNLSSSPLTLTLFHYVDLNVHDTYHGDVSHVFSQNPNFLWFTDEAEPEAALRYQASGAVHRQVGAYPGIRDQLNDASLTELSDSVAFGPGDAVAAFEFEATVAPGYVRHVGHIALSSRLPRDHVPSAFASLTSFPSLLTRDAANPSRYDRWGFRRTSAVFPNGLMTVPGGRVPLAIDDFSGSYEDRLVSRDPATGKVDISSVPMVPSPPTDWVLCSTGDFNGDGQADLLWRDGTRKLVVWLMRGARRIGTLVPFPDQVADPNWDVAGSADFDGDGLRDLLWYDRSSGSVVIWYLNSQLQRMGEAYTTPPSPGTNQWRVVAVGDFGKGAAGVLDTPDIVWQDDASKKIVVWHLDRAAVRTSGVFTTPDQLGQRVVFGPR